MLSPLFRHEDSSMKNILVFGDSLVYGAWDTNGGWVSYLRHFYDQKTLNSEFRDVTLVFNLGINGETSAGLLERFQNELEQRVSGGEDVSIIVGVGMNDSQWRTEDKKTAVLLSEYKDNIKKLIIIGKDYAAKQIYIGLPPVDQSKVDPMPWSEGHSYRNDLISEFNNALKEVCGQEKITFIDLQTELNKDFWIQLLIDGAHPGSEGHRQIFELVKNYVN